MLRRVKKKVMVFLLLLFIPFLLGVFSREEEWVEYTEGKFSDAGFEVVVTNATGSYTYDPEELIPYMVAAIVPFGTDEQLLQALAIMCRTNLMYHWEANGKQNILPFEECGLPVCSYYEYKKRLAVKIQNAEDKEDDIQRAVEATEGIILLCEDKVIHAPFFYLSAGSTRASSKDGFAHLLEKDCGEDIHHNRYLKKYYFDKEEFYTRLGELLPGTVSEAEVINITNSMQDWEIKRDSSGYVCALFYKKEQIYVDAISFCNAFGLCSPCFEVEERETEIVIITKGVGHGFGLNLSYAMTQAQNGMSCYEILNYYYANIRKDKGYNVIVQ